LKIVRPDLRRAGLARQRTIDRDLAFGLRMLVDIAIRASLGSAA
jgi:uncharacterized membrane protein